MRFFQLLYIAILLLAVSALASNISRDAVCDYKAKGDLAQLQYEALVGFADLLIVKRDVLAAFDRYIPGWVMVNRNKHFKRRTNWYDYHREYKQHNPFAEQGRDFAVQVLSKGLAEGNTLRNLTFFSGQGYGMMHYRVDVPLTGKAFAIADHFKFRGNCIVEHWDVLQEITGNEPNPIAYF